MLADKRLDNNGLFSDAKTSITITSSDRMDPLHPTVQDIHISDIAHALSRTCRYNGHVGHFYSVARHSLFVADRVRGRKLSDAVWTFDCTNGSLVGKSRLEREAVYAGPREEMQALLHDAAEAYLGDLVRPLKHGPSMGTPYMEAERNLEKVIADRFNLEYPWPSYVDEADKYVLLERELSGENLRWTWNSTPDEDEQEFLTRFRNLVSDRRTL